MKRGRWSSRASVRSAAILAAAVLAIERLVFIGVHVKYRETPTIIMCFSV